MSEEENRLIALLNETHNWPCLYAFKFIVPANKAKELEAAITQPVKVEVRPSGGGKYIAYTFHCAVSSAQEVLGIYSSVRGISGLVSL